MQSIAQSRAFPASRNKPVFLCTERPEETDWICNFKNRSCYLYTFLFFKIGFNFYAWIRFNEVHKILLKYLCFSRVDVTQSFFIKSLCMHILKLFIILSLTINKTNGFLLVLSQYCRVHVLYSWRSLLFSHIDSMIRPVVMMFKIILAWSVLLYKITKCPKKSIY